MISEWCKGFRLYDHHGRPILVSSQGELAPGSPHLAPATFSLVSATAVPSLCNFPTLSPVAALAAVADEAFRARISNPYSGTATREAHSIRPILLRQTILMSGWQLRFSIAKLASLLKTSVIPDGCSEFHGARQAIVRRLVTSLLATDSNDCDGGGSYCMPVSMNPIPHHDDPFPADVPLEHRNTYGWSAKTIRLVRLRLLLEATRLLVVIVCDCRQLSLARGTPRKTLSQSTTVLPPYFEIKSGMVLGHADWDIRSTQCN